MPDHVSALDLVLAGDPALFAIVRLSLVVSLAAVGLATLVALPSGAWVALARLPGRAAGEVGAVIIVGGNIEGFTRTMTTAIALETSKGDLPLAIGLGLVLIAIVVVVNAAAWALRYAGERRSG